MPFSKVAVLDVNRLELRSYSAAIFIKDIVSSIVRSRFSSEFIWREGGREGER